MKKVKKYWAKRENKEKQRGRSVTLRQGTRISYMEMPNHKTRGQICRVVNQTVPAQRDYANLTCPFHFLHATFILRVNLNLCFFFFSHYYFSLFASHFFFKIELLWDFGLYGWNLEMVYTLQIIQIFILSFTLHKKKLK